MNQAVQGIVLAAAGAMGWILLVGTWPTAVPILQCRVRAVAMDLARSSPFASKEAATEFWGQAQSFRLLVAVVVTTLGTLGGAVAGFHAKRSLFFSGCTAGFVYVALWLLSEWRLRRSLRAGGCG